MAARNHRVSLKTLPTGEIEVTHEWQWVEERFATWVERDVKAAEKRAKRLARRYLDTFPHGGESHDTAGNVEKCLGCFEAFYAQPDAA